jgi:tetraacyldisaccharide 4'-kinase
VGDAMNPLCQLYGGITSFRNGLYDRHVLRPQRLRLPVISVGNLSVGGSGKTPFVVLLGELLTSRGIAFDVLSRGYRRKSSETARVDPEGTPEQFGDEPLLIARKLRCPVFVGTSRYRAGLLAEKQLGPAIRVHLLDDGFQHRQLARDFDIVLVTPEDATGSLLPTGRLRERPKSLTRADVVALSEGMSVEGVPSGIKHVWRVNRRLQVPRIPGPAIAFAGVARPQRFFEELRREGVELKDQIGFRDHYRYQASDIRHLEKLSKRKGATIFVTTEKDEINLGSFVSQLNPVIVPMKMELTAEDRAMALLLDTLGQRGYPLA